MPKFLFLNSIAVAKTEGQDAFISELREMIDKYPESDVSAMAKDMLAMLNVGAESQADGEISNLADKRTTIETGIDSSLVDAPKDSLTNSGTIKIYNRDTDLYLKVLKVDSKKHEIYLAGAEFQLQKNGNT